MKVINKYLIIFIILLASFLRLYDLGVTPPSLDWDEAAIGYNAYSILKTGRDEYGTFLPLAFRSFDDYKPPLYVYLTVPSVAVFGLNEFAVRFPSALLGILTILFTYLLVFEFTKEKKLALLSSLFLAISPWHLQFSRVAFESNAALFFIVSGVYFFLKGINKNPRFLILSSPLLVLSMYTYHSARLFTPLLVVGLMLIYYKKAKTTALAVGLYKKKIVSLKKYAAVALVFAAILAVPLIGIMFSKEGQARLSGVANLGGDQWTKVQQIIKQQEDDSSGLVIGKLLHNRRIIYVQNILNGYLSHFTPNFLFMPQTSDRQHIPGTGLLYFWDIPFLLMGFYFLFRNKPNWIYLLFWWLLISPIAAAPTAEVPHAIRTLVFLPTFQIIIAYGFLNFIEKVKHKKLLSLLACLLLLFNFLYYLHMYYVHAPLETSDEWQYGYKQAVSEVMQRQNNYNQVIFSNTLEQPHIFFLFYSKYDPAKYLSFGGTKYSGFDKEHIFNFDKYTFGPLLNVSESGDNKILMIGTPIDISKEEPKLVTIKNLGGEDVIYLTQKR